MATLHSCLFLPERFRKWKENPFSFIPQGGGEYENDYRCPVERITAEIIKASIHQLIPCEQECRDPPWQIDPGVPYLLPLSRSLLHLPANVILRSRQLWIKIHRDHFVDLNKMIPMAWPDTSQATFTLMSFLRALRVMRFPHPGAIFDNGITVEMISQ
jgi:hypothetical protein